MTDRYFYSPQTGGFYSSAVHSDMPADVVEVSAERYDELLDAQDAGEVIVVGENGEPEARWPTVDLDTLKVRLAASIDAAAENERLKYITSGAGQAMTYQRKAEEARACLVATDPQPADYPMLAAEIGITAATLTGVAEVVNAAYQAWLAIGAQIEAARLGAKAAIDAATTADEARAAAEAVVWPNP